MAPRRPGVPVWPGRIVDAEPGMMRSLQFGGRLDSRPARPGRLPMWRDRVLPLWPKGLRALAALVVACLLPKPVLAHGDLHERIEALDRQIASDPRNPDFRIQRGELHRLHGDWDAALADLDQAASLDPKLPALDFLRGRLLADAGWPLSARVALDRFVTRNPRHVESRIARARVLVKLDRRLAAAEDFSRAIADSPESRPDLYVERAQALTGEGPAHYAQALKGLEEGARKLGPLVVLQLYAADLEVKLKRYDEALARLDRLAEQAPRKETWFARKGEILREAGRIEESQAAFRAALAALEQLPIARRNVPAMQELEKRLQQALTSNGPPRRVEAPAPSLQP
jgi:tetratricopeptide (TPR) repeat protein